MQVSPRPDRRHTAAEERRLAFVEPAVPDRRRDHGQPAVKVAQTAVDHNAVLPPDYTELGERTGERERERREGDMEGGRKR